MKQYSTPDQTAKLIELGFEKPKSISGYCQRGPYEYDAETNTKMVVYDDTQYPIYAYSIGELIEMLPEFSCIYDLTNMQEMKRCWYVGHVSTLNVSADELIDALYNMVIKLKEEGVI